MADMDFIIGEGTEPIITLVVASRYEDLREKFVSSLKAKNPGCCCKVVITDTSVIEEKDFCFGTVYNNMINKVETEYVFILNDDIYPMVDYWVSELIRALEKYNLSAVSPAWVTKLNGSPALYQKPDVRIARKGFPEESISGGSFLCRTKDIKYIDGFDTNYKWTLNDIDLTWRMNELRHYDEAAYLGWIIIHHPDKSTYNKSTKKSIYDEWEQQTIAYHKNKWNIKD